MFSLFSYGSYLIGATVGMAVGFAMGKGSERRAIWLWLVALKNTRESQAGMNNYTAAIHLEGTRDTVEQFKRWRMR